MINKTLPIGIIDSGKGGMGVINYLSFTLINEDFLFYMDHKNFPYGNKSRKDLIEIGNEAFNNLKEKVKIIIIACNTLSCYLDIDINKPVYKINECIMEEIKKKIKKGKVLFLTTYLTKRSNYFQDECEKIGINANVVSCPRLVTMIENKTCSYEEVKKILRLESENKYDAVVLGCTHFYHIENHLKRLFPDAHIISGFNILKKKIKKDLRKYKLKNNKKTGSIIKVYKT